jgi:hypothetical protein
MKGAYGDLSPPAMNICPAGEHFVSHCGVMFAIGYDRNLSSPSVSVSSVTLE